MKGYNPKFLDENMEIQIPWIDYDVYADVLKRDQLREEYIADYQHYSVVMSKSNRQALLSICNLDQSKYRSVKGRRWFLDPRIGEENQLSNIYYKDYDEAYNYWDRGHLTRRTAVTWGDNNYVAKLASNDSCSFANASLQHKYFNEDEWRIPEIVAQKFDRDLNDKLSIITGPLFTPNDRWFSPPGTSVPLARIPSGFWKVIYYIDKKKSDVAGHNVLGCEAYLVYQDRLAMTNKDGADQIDYRTLQVTISELTDLTGIRFQKELFDANPLWYYTTEDRGIEEPERYEIKVAGRSEGVKEGWPGHVIHDRDDIAKHEFTRITT